MVRRLFGQIRELILLELSKGQSTINKISINTGINWKTVDNHMIFLIGKGFVKEVFRSEYVHIFEITDSGKLKVIEIKENLKKLIEGRSDDDVDENVIVKGDGSYLIYEEEDEEESLDEPIDKPVDRLNNNDEQIDEYINYRQNNREL
ncbi:hypothetical protein ACFL0W_03705 [Nanoarchaeota archaeon]